MATSGRSHPQMEHHLLLADGSAVVYAAGVPSCPVDIFSVRELSLSDSVSSICDSFSVLSTPRSLRVSALKRPMAHGGSINSYTVSPTSEALYGTASNIPYHTYRHKGVVDGIVIRSMAAAGTTVAKSFPDSQPCKSEARLHHPVVAPSPLLIDLIPAQKTACSKPNIRQRV